MAVIVTVDSDQMTKAAYDKIRAIANWEGDPPAGGIFHVASFDDDGLHVIDVWESAADFESFLNERIIPNLASLGVTSQPTVSVIEAHAYSVLGG